MKLKYIAISLAIIGITGYSYHQTRGFSNGAILVLDYPSDGMTLTKSSINVKGIIKNATYATLDGRQIFIDENGKFNERLLLSPGYNVVEIKLKDRFDRIKTKKLELIYKPSF